MKTQFAQDLRDSLGAESAGLWIFFMDKVQATLPFLIGVAGRPKVDAVRASAIGLAGFDSWFSMVEASPDEGGLGWSIDSWKAWKRAYAVVQAHPYLRNLELTASEINTLSREIQPFPPTPEALEAAKLERTQQLNAKRGNAVAALQGQLSDSKNAVESLNTQLSRAVAALETSKEALAARDSEYVELNNKHQQAIGRLKVMEDRVTELAAAEKQKDATIEKQKAQVARYAKMTWLDYFKAIFKTKK